MSLGQLSSAAGPSYQRSQPAFDFTKRKRWADILINELSEAIILVLSSSRVILFCGTGVTELLGWRDIELIDHDLADFIHADDQHAFRNNFDESLRMRSELTCYVRLKCKNHLPQNSDYRPPPKEVLFELQGYPHYVDDEVDCRCFFAVAKPYPSRNTAMLNTFLELKIENERLQQRLAELRIRVPSGSSSIVPSNSNSASVYGMNSMPTTESMTIVNSIPSTSQHPDPNTSYYPIHRNMSSYENIKPHSLGDTFEPMNALAYTGYFTPAVLPSSVDEETSEEGLKRKKFKKVHSSDQYVCVTCGRTDSPEWRKGPQGPKTLCNACGLRWAKQMRKDDTNESGSNGEGSQKPGQSSGAV
ncbi:hypothetical protein SERLA73DRAFT_186737 [Serpula lacrymans var. lacrymans S7.3]|uniref:Uncharacterized protein n=2 Tax=Serpula lacrymans var. lacrymans TaxID=341189 RepID=F8Q7T8_SERL3|nr:white collar 2 type of transcription factor [Serpula lacrymans var. lacrymans S7.9]EGN95626.1 hypothetical protein SERLA73DRAFT_186737 [Serpula lacrymans var. lacrymans S7.3]EGO21154.1 white collar 2 type of transcription factor [Serpula lacrymans var. lacrymans S7.9]